MGIIPILFLCVGIIASTKGSTEPNEQENKTKSPDHEKQHTKPGEEQQNKIANDEKQVRKPNDETQTTIAHQGEDKKQLYEYQIKKSDDGTESTIPDNELPAEWGVHEDRLAYQLANATNITPLLNSNKMPVQMRPNFRKYFDAIENCVVYEQISFGKWRRLHPFPRMEESKNFTRFTTLENGTEIRTRSQYYYSYDNVKWFRPTRIKINVTRPGFSNQSHFYKYKFGPKQWYDPHLGKFPNITNMTFQDMGPGRAVFHFENESDWFRPPVNFKGDPNLMPIQQKGYGDPLGKDGLSYIYGPVDGREKYLTQQNYNTNQMQNSRPYNSNRRWFSQPNDPYGGRRYYRPYNNDPYYGGRRWNQQYGQPYGQPYSQSYGQSYGERRWNRPYADPYERRHWDPYQNEYDDRGRDRPNHDPYGERKDRTYNNADYDRRRYDRPEQQSYDNRRYDRYDRPESYDNRGYDRPSYDGRRKDDVYTNEERRWDRFYKNTQEGYNDEGRRRDYQYNDAYEGRMRDRQYSDRYDYPNNARYEDRRQAPQSYNGSRDDGRMQNYRSYDGYQNQRYYGGYGGDGGRGRIRKSSRDFPHGESYEEHKWQYAYLDQNKIPISKEKQEKYFLQEYYDILGKAAKNLWKSHRDIRTILQDYEIMRQEGISPAVLPVLVNGTMTMISNQASTIQTKMEGNLTIHDVTQPIDRAMYARTLNNFDKMRDSVRIYLRPKGSPLKVEDLINKLLTYKQNFFLTYGDITHMVAVLRRTMKRYGFYIMTQL